jgi:hypothetical protein
MDDYAVIIARHTAGDTYRVLSRDYGIHPGSIKRICRSHLCSPHHPRAGLFSSLALSEHPARVHECADSPWEGGRTRLTASHGSILRVQLIM